MSGLKKEDLADATGDDNMTCRHGEGFKPEIASRISGLNCCGSSSGPQQTEHTSPTTAGNTNQSVEAGQAASKTTDLQTRIDYWENLSYR